MPTNGDGALPSAAGASSSSEPKAATNISHLIKRKRKSSEGAEGSSAKKPSTWTELGGQLCYVTVKLRWMHGCYWKPSRTILLRSYESSVIYFGWSLNESIHKTFTIKPITEFSTRTSRVFPIVKALMSSGFVLTNLMMFVEIFCTIFVGT